MTTEAPPSKFQSPGKFKVVKGSILAPHNAGLRLVLSISNLAGKVEDNPLYSIFNNKWSRVKVEARGWYTNKTGAYKLGATYTTAVQSDTWVVHLLAQNQDLTTDLVGLEACLKEVRKMAKYEHASVHLSDLLVKSIPELPQMLTDQLINYGISVSVYQDEK